MRFKGNDAGWSERGGEAKQKQVKAWGWRVVGADPEGDAVSHGPVSHGPISGGGKKVALFVTRRPKTSAIKVNH